MYLLDQLPVREHLLALQSKANVDFTRSLLPGVDNVLGLRVGDQRELGRRIAQTPDWRDFLSEPADEFMEQRMVQGFVLGAIPNSPIEDYLSLVSEFVSRVSSWSVCDCFEFSGKRSWVAAHAERVWSYLCEWMHSQREYEIRFGVVQALQYFVDEAHLLSFFDELAVIRHEGYYVKMAVAWAVSVCFVKYPELTRAFLEQQRLDVWTHNKSIQKIRESLRVDKETKENLKLLKRKA